MPKIPDFDQIARVIVTLVEPERPREATLQLILKVRDDLRGAWNARGAADRAQIDSELSIVMGNTAAEPYVNTLRRALTTLDR